MARLGVAYIALCEFLLAVIFGPVGLFVAFLGGREMNWKAMLIGVALMALAGGAASCGFSLAGQKAWSVKWSWILGAITVALACEIIRDAMNINSDGDGGEAGLLGIAMLFFAVPALLVLALPATRRYVREGKEAI